MKYGLSSQTVAKICRVFSQYPEIEKAILYGSRAKGNYRKGSDIDLTLVAANGKNINQNTLFKIDESLDELMLAYSFDISIMAEIDNPSLIDHIQSVGQTFYQK